MEFGFINNNQLGGVKKGISYGFGCGVRPYVLLNEGVCVSDLEVRKDGLEEDWIGGTDRQSKIESLFEEIENGAISE